MMKCGSEERESCVTAEKRDGEAGRPGRLDWQEEQDFARERKLNDPSPYPGSDCYRE